MVIGAFPAAKLGLLAVRQVSKPIANIIKDKAKTSKYFRDYVCMPPAQLYNWVEVKTKMWALNLGKPVAVPPLNEAMAIELGANLLGEFIIFFIGAGVLVFEYSRQSSNEAKKQESLRQEKAELTQQLAELGFRLEKQDTQIRELTRVLAFMESHSIFRWGKERLSEYETFDAGKPDQSIKASTGYNSKRSSLSKALKYLETEIFVDKRKEQKILFEETVHAYEPNQSKKASSDYNAEGSSLSKALYYLETEIFVDKRKEQKILSEEVELQPYVVNQPQPALQ